MAYVECQLPKLNAAYKRAKRLGKSDENDVDVMKHAQSIYRDEHKGVAFCQEDAWAILKFHPKWDAPEQVDLTGDVPGATQEDLFSHDARPRPAGKPRPAKKTKSDATASTSGSSASTQFGELMEQELRLKREAAERAFETQAKKDRTFMRKRHTLNANCQKYNAAYKRAKCLGKSGENNVNVLKRAQSIYRDEHKGVPFCQEYAWAILKFHSKWDAPEQVDLTGDVIGATQEDLFDDDDAYWIKKQKRLIKNKMRNDLDDEDDEDE
nr:hypothetical protein [Tanacetum cinerariifolium]